MINSMTAGSASDVWGVGSEYVDPHWVGLAEHWDGSRWRRVATPSGDSVQLLGVSEVAPDDVWAVGAGGDLGAQRPVILHWDGSNWAVVPGAPQVTAGWFSAVTARSVDDVWAVGIGTRSKVLVEHWDGLEWSVVHTPRLGGHDDSSLLNSVAFSSPTDGWALGYSCGTGQATCPSVALHWDGLRWPKVSLPDPSKSLHFGSVATVSPTDAWAVGSDDHHGWRHLEPVTAHWDGNSWTTVPFPRAADGALYSVVAVGSGDVWAFGDYRDGRQVLPLVGHFDGSGWTVSAMPGGRAKHTYLSGAAAIGPNDVWAGGETGKATFLRHWNGTGWS